MNAAAFEGRCYIVTGAASGIGLVTVERLLRAGARVMAWDIASAPEHAPAGDVAWRIVDVGDEAQVEAAAADAVAHLGRLDGVANVAGTVLAFGTRLVDLPLTVWEDTWRVNTTGVFLVMKHTVPRLGPGGAVVNVASEAGLRGRNGLAAYGAAKAAVISLTRSAAKEYGPDGIRVTCVCPGGVDTPLLRVAGDGAIAGIERRTPLGRVGRPEDIAAAIVFLLSDEAGYVTGESVRVDGGWLA